MMILQQSNKFFKCEPIMKVLAAQIVYQNKQQLDFLSRPKKLMMSCGCIMVYTSHLVMFRTTINILIKNFQLPVAIASYSNCQYYQSGKNPHLVYIYLNKDIELPNKASYTSPNMMMLFLRKTDSLIRL